MAFRFIAFATLLAYAHAGVLQGAPLAYAAAPAQLAYAAPGEEYDPNPQYSYGYDIQDNLTGDSKSQSETRNGDVVEGSYSVGEPDGTRRIVDYTADPVNGFNAVVRKEPATVAVKTVATAPAIARVAAPLAYAHQIAPIARVAAPVAYAAAPAAYAAHPAHIAYSAAPAVARVAYSSPAISYHL